MKDYSYKEYLIPKKNKKFRKIVAPSQDLLEYQQSVLPKLEVIYLEKVSGTRISDTAHGFIRGRNCVTASEKHIGYKSTVIMDLSNFFDTVFREMFDTEEYKIIYDDNNLFHKSGYCAQGFATSPILANIALIPAMTEIDDYLSSKFKEYAFTIYADDIQISTNCEESEDIIDIIAEPITKIVEKNGFGINPNKTRIRYSKYGYRKMLGINVGEDHIRATRKTMKKIRAAKHQENGSSLGGLTTWSRCYPPSYRR